MENVIYENCYDANEKRLNLSHRNLKSLDDAIIATFAHCTEHLDLSHNRINNINWIYKFPHLKCLIMDDNRLRETHFENLREPLRKIQTLMLNKNEFNDLKTTAGFLQRLFPNVEYLSLHGNAMCPDNLLLQPFSEFVPYEYSHYRSTLLQSLPNLKFLDHFSLNSMHLKVQTVKSQINQEPNLHHQHQQQKQFLATTYKELWSKLNGFLRLNSNRAPTNPPTTTTKSNFVLPYAPPSYNASYKGLNSEGNRYITNSDL